MEKKFRVTQTFRAPIAWTWGLYNSGQMVMDLPAGLEMEVADFGDYADEHQWAVMAFGLRKRVTILFGLKDGCWMRLPERVVIEPDPDQPSADPAEVADGVAGFLAALAQKVEAAGGPANFWGVT